MRLRSSCFVPLPLQPSTRVKQRIVETSRIADRHLRTEPMMVIRFWAPFPPQSTGNASAPGVTVIDGSSRSNQNDQVRITLQNLTPTTNFRDIFVAIHSDQVRFFEVGKPASNELSSFLENGNEDAFGSINSNGIYGNTTASLLVSPGQYYNFSVPLSLPSRLQGEQLADALDDLDASITVIGRFTGDRDGFFAVDAEDVGDRVETASGAAYSIASGFLTYHTGSINNSIAFYTGEVSFLQILAD